MKAIRIIFLVLIATLLSFAPKSDSYETLKIGATVPMTDYEMLDISGKKVTLADIKKDNGLLVIFSCNTCPYVIAWEDRYPVIAEQAKKNNIGMILINSNEAKRGDDDSFENMKKHAKKYKYTFSYTVDTNSKLANAFGATRTPHTFLFNADNKLVYQGGIDDNHKSAADVKKPYLKMAITAVSNNKDVEHTILRSPGCSIKRL